MPFCNLHLGKAIDQSGKKEVLSALSKLIAETMNKPETYVMVSITQAELYMSGSIGDAAFVDLRSIGGINSASTKLLSQKISLLLQQKLDIPQNRIFCNFTDVSGQNWGWNGSTLG